MESEGSQANSIKILSPILTRHSVGASRVWLMSLHLSHAAFSTSVAQMFSFFSTSPSSLKSLSSCLEHRSGVPACLPGPLLRTQGESQCVRGSLYFKPVVDPEAVAGLSE